MTVWDSPFSPYIFLRDADRDRGLVLKTQPFYSMFYYLDDPDTNAAFTRSVRGALPRLALPNRRRCDRVCPTDPTYNFYKKIPFSVFSASGMGAPNLYFLLVVLLATLVLGAITLSYWTYLLGNQKMGDDFHRAIQWRSVYLSVLFVAMTMVFSVMLYELFTLKFFSLGWFQQYEAGQHTNFYSFFTNTRRMLLWVFLMFGLLVVLFTTTILVKRPQQFKKQIVLNIVAILVLFCAQYIYYQNPSSPYIKTFSLFLSVFILGLVMSLLYAT